MSRPVSGQGHAGEVANEQRTPVSCVCVCVVHFCECVPSAWARSGSPVCCCGADGFFVPESSVTNCRCSFGYVLLVTSNDSKG